MLVPVRFFFNKIWFSEIVGQGQTRRKTLWSGRAAVDLGWLWGWRWRGHPADDVAWGATTSAAVPA